MARNTSKTPIQIANELQARADAAKARAAISTADGNPVLAQVQAMIDSKNKEIATNARKLSGKNSFEIRECSASLRLDWIRAEAALTVEKDSIDKIRKDYLQHSAADLAIRIANGETVSEGDVTTIVANLPYSEVLATLVSVEIDAKTAWRDYVAKNGGNTQSLEAQG